jgi:hypothetical protein
MHFLPCRNLVSGSYQVSYGTNELSMITCFYTQTSFPILDLFQSNLEVLLSLFSSILATPFSVVTSGLENIILFHNLLSPQSLPDF